MEHSSDGNQSERLGPDRVDEFVGEFPDRARVMRGFFRCRQWEQW